MTRTTNARLAGFTFLFYIAAGVTSLVLSGRATAGEGIAAKLAAIAQHTTDLRLTVLLGLLQAFSALVLGVTLYALTREQDPDLAMLGLTCRVAEGITGVFVAPTLGLLWLATGAAASASDTGPAHLLGGWLLAMGAWGPAAIFFAVGSTLFSWLLLRGRMIPAALGWLGVLASVLLVVALPVDFAGLFSVPFAVWLPMLVFELMLAVWLLVRGVAAPASTHTP